VLVAALLAVFICVLLAPFFVGALERTRPFWVTLGARVGDIGKWLMNSIYFAFRWLYSVKDDVLAGEDDEVNPVSMVSKLLIIAFSVMGIIIFSIAAIQGRAF